VLYSEGMSYSEYREGMSPLAKGVIAVVVLAGIGGGIYWWKTKQAPPPPPPPPVAQPVPPPPPPAAPPDAAPAIANPIEREKEPLPEPADQDEYIRKQLEKLFGKKGVLTFLSIDSFVRGFVATVDNLGNEHAPPALWQVKPMDGRFQTDGQTISASNQARYTAFIRFVQAVDTGRAVSLYRRLYPLFQQAYEDLGYPGKYFNDRVVVVIDHLLETPEVSGPIRVKLVEPPGGGRPGRPVFQYEDPTLERRSAGQKILLRMGPQNAAALKAKLRDIRGRIARGPGGR
jgi:hypothetical protein